ncbi:MAG: lipopolysaccharide kinase InaA family protein [Desulfuromonadales bacterium]
MERNPLRVAETSFPLDSEDDLSRLFSRADAALSGRARRALAEDLGRQVRRLHDGGGVRVLWWRDRQRLLPPHAAGAPVKRPGLRGREKNLIRAWREAGGHCRRADMVRFLRGYLGGIRDSAAREFIRRLFRHSPYALRQQLHRRRFLAASDLVSGEQTGGFRVLRDKSMDGSPIAAHLAGGPEAALAGGASLTGRGRGCRAARIEVAGASYFLKSFAGGRRLWRSRAKRVWLLSWRLRANNIPVPRPLLLGEGAAQTYLLTDFAEGYRRFADLWPQAGPAQQKTLLARAAILLGRLHRLGWIHGDFNWNNILVGPQGDLLLVDLDCAKPARWFAGDRPFRDVQHFLRDLLRQSNQGEPWKDFFLCIWRRWSGADSSPCLPGKRSTDETPLSH